MKKHMTGGAKLGFSFSVVLFLVCIGLIAYKRRQKDILLVLGLFGVFVALTGDVAGSLLTASVFGLAYLYFSPRHEGFADAKEKEKEIPPPDNGDRAEMFQLGKKYKMPNEKEDSEFHLDAGTTFMNAYKALKPEQVAAMTKDTQELMETQKQLMSTLQTLKPLITDGKQMMDMFQSYFGAGNPTPNVSNQHVSKQMGITDLFRRRHRTFIALPSYQEGFADTKDAKFSPDLASYQLLTSVMGPIRRISSVLLDPSNWKERIAMMNMNPQELARMYMQSQKSGMEKQSE